MPSSSRWTPYRSVNLTAPEEISDEDLIEVTLRWGEQVLAVTHLRRGERFDHPLSNDGSRVSFEVSRGACCEVSVPDGASAWIVRDGRCEQRRSTFALPHDATACVDRGALTLRVRRVAPPEAMVRPRRVTPFAAVTACALALTSTGVAWAASLDADADAPIVAPREGSHAWIVAHAWSREHDPLPAPRDGEGLMVGRSIAVPRGVSSCCFGCCVPFEHGGADFDPTDEGCFSSLFDRFIGRPDVPSPLVSRVSVGRVIGGDASRASEIRHGVSARRADVVACNRATPGASGSITLRMVIASSGSVLAAAVASSTHPSVAFASCVASQARAWRFEPSLNDEPVTVDARLTMR